MSGNHGESQPSIGCRGIAVRFRKSLSGNRTSGNRGFGCLGGQPPGINGCLPKESSSSPKRPEESLSGHGHGSNPSFGRGGLDSEFQLSYRCTRRHSSFLKSVTRSSLISAGAGCAAIKSGRAQALIGSRTIR